MATLIRKCLVPPRRISHAWFRNCKHFGTFQQGHKIKTQPVVPYCCGNDDNRNTVIDEVFKQKESKGLSVDDIASHLGYTNLYTAQILALKTPLNPSKAGRLGELLDLPSSTLDEMMKAGLRRYDGDVTQEPTVYRLMEAVSHYGESIKLLINEKCGDGIPSAIDMYCDLDVVKGKKGEDRIVIKFDMKYLQFIEQNESDKPDI
eukprot:236418_1